MMLPAELPMRSFSIPTMEISGVPTPSKDTQGSVPGPEDWPGLFADLERP